MDARVMIHKVNSIAQFFSAYPREEAVAGIADHLQRFWEPRMRRQLLEHLQQGGGELNELVIEAAQRLHG